MTPHSHRWRWLAIALIVVVLAAAFILPRQMGTGAELRDRVAEALSEWAGAKVTMTDPLHVSYFPPLSLRGGLAVTNATNLPAVRDIIAPDVKISLDLIELLMGRIEIAAVQLRSPTFTLKDPAASLRHAKPGLPASYPAAVTNTPVEAVRIQKGTVKTAADKQLIRDLDVLLDVTRRSGAVTATGSLEYRDRRVAFTIDTGAISETEGVKTAPLGVEIESAPISARFSGTGQFTEVLEANGTMEAEMSDARDFLDWMGHSLPKGQSLRDLKAAGTVHWSGQTLTFNDGAFSLDGNEAVGSASVTAGTRPRVDGTLAFETLMLDPYFVGEDDQNPKRALFDWALLKYLDADLRLSAAKITTPYIELGRSGVTITATKGAISTEIGELHLCNGQATGRVGLDLSEPRIRATLAGKFRGVAIEPCLQPFDLAIPVKGIGGLKIDVSTSGSTHEELVRGLAGSFTLRARKGAIPIDLPALAAGDTDSHPGWSPKAIADFKTLSAQCSLSAGHIWCRSFDMRTPNGTVSGAGGVNMRRQSLHWDFSVANPVAPLNPTQLVMKKRPRVILRGSLAEPMIEGAPAVEDGSE